MKLLRRIAIMSLCVLALSGCTKSSISNEAPVSGSEGVAPDKNGFDDDDETLAREDNILIEDETEEQSMYDWEQVKDETDGLFMGNPQYPQSETMSFEADEDALSIKLTWIVKDGTSAQEAMEYAADMVKKFNDIVAVQSEDLNSSTETSFGDLWDTFSLTVQVGTKDGSWLIDKTYKAGEKIDLVPSATNSEGPTPEEYKGPVKDSQKK